MDQMMEREIVHTFFLKEKRARAEYALCSKKRRTYIWGLDETFFCVSDGIDITLKTPDEVRELLIKCGGLCYVISVDEEIDGAYLSITDALQVVGNGPAIVAFPETHRVYFEGEYEIGAKTKRFILGI